MSRGELEEKSWPGSLAALFDVPVVVESAVPRLVDDQLYPEERIYLARSVAVRRAEFGMARLCARRALGQLGYRPVPLLPYPDRSPRWPFGVVGSITHCRRRCAVVVSCAPTVAGLGLDLEEDGGLPGDVEAVVCTAGERAWLDGQGTFRRQALSKLVFSAKESFYKGQYGVTRKLLDFQDVELKFELGAGGMSGRFRASGLHERVPARRQLLAAEGRFRFFAADCLIATAMILPRL